jgi:hypothetical protein
MSAIHYHARKETMYEKSEKRSWERRAVMFALATAIALGSFSLVSSPAHAAFSDCPPGWGCGWTGYTYTGSRGQWAGTNWYWGDAWNDRVRSAGSNGTSGMAFCIYEHAGYTGYSMRFGPGYGSSNIGLINSRPWPSSNRWTWGSC